MSSFSFLKKKQITFGVFVGFFFPRVGKRNENKAALTNKKNKSGGTNSGGKIFCFVSFSKLVHSPRDGGERNHGERVDLSGFFLAPDRSGRASR